MASVNKVMLIGNMTRTIELKTVGSTVVGEFGLAMNEKYTKKNGEKVEEVCFVDVTVWGPQAENIFKYTLKGSSVHVEGKLKLDQWDDKNGGGKRSKLTVTATNVTFLDQKSDSQPAPQPTTSGQQRPKPQSQPTAAPAGPIVPEDDIPF